MPARGEPITLDEYFGEHADSRRLHEAVVSALSEIGEFEERVTKSQVAFRRRRGFAWTWMPGTYLKGELAPLVLTVDLRRLDESPRWKEVVEPRPGIYTHHLELRSPDDVDEQVRAWLREAWERAA